MTMPDLDFTPPLEVKLASDSGLVEGYASTYGNLDLVGDIVAAGAFRRTMEQHRAAHTMPKMLWGHDPASPVGVWLDARDDAKGLLVTGRLTLGTQRGAEARALAKDGALALSIGYRPKKIGRRGDARVIEEAELLEVSLVGMPANPQATITSIKSLSDVASIQDAVAFETWLRSAGFARSLAKSIAHAARQCFAKSDELDPAALDAIAEMFRRKSERITTLTKGLKR
jgi:HK97 family phage prohead protease